MMYESRTKKVFYHIQISKLLTNKIRRMCYWNFLISSSLDKKTKKTKKARSRTARKHVKTSKNQRERKHKL